MICIRGHLSHCFLFGELHPARGEELKKSQVEGQGGKGRRMSSARSRGRAGKMGRGVRDHKAGHTYSKLGWRVLVDPEKC